MRERERAEREQRAERAESVVVALYRKQSKPTTRVGTVIRWIAMAWSR